jgi:hypothetical protein
MNVNDFVDGLVAHPDSNIVSNEEWEAQQQETYEYEVTITEISSHVYVVEAATSEEAEIAARDRYDSGDEGDQDGIPSDIHTVEVQMRL